MSSNDFLVTLVGPPNSGKTTLFNYLSGKSFKTVNYPGSTVEYSTSRFQNKFGINANLLDSPGIISLTPASPDEEVSVNSLYNHPVYGTPDLLIATVDSSQLTRHLFLVNQLVLSGFRVIVVLTMNDILFKRGFEINSKVLSEHLKCDVVFFNGRNGSGLDSLIQTVKKNIDEINRSNKKIPSNGNGDLSKSDLLKIYRDIEILADKSLTPFQEHLNKNIARANEQLKILDPVLSRPNNKPDKFTLKIDKILLHRYYGLLFFFLLMALTFTSIFWIADPFMGMVDDFFSFLGSNAINLFGNTWYGHLIADGIIGGTGSVLVFLPQILILFLIIGLLEDTGYLARGAMLIDKPLSKIGLNGKSFVPMLSGFACAIPAMLAARTISNRRERLLTIFIIPLMSCSARLPVYVLLIAFLTPSDKPWLGGIILASIYVFSIVSSLFIAGLINKFNRRIINTTDNSSFILELPAYRIPKPKIVLRNSYENAKQYIFRAGPIILLLSMVLWFLTYFPNHSPQIEKQNLSEDQIILMEKSERLADSYAAQLGKIIQPVMTPLGMDWRIGVSLIAAFAAREVFVSSMALIFKITDEENIEASMLKAMRDAEIGDTGQKLFTTSTILGLIVFFVFALQCISTIAVSRKETGGWRIPIYQLVIFTFSAYVFALITVNGLRFIGLD